MGTEFTRTRGVRLVATGLIYQGSAKRCWGILSNAGTGSIVLRDGGAAGVVLWDGGIAAGQWIPFIAPIVATLTNGIHATLTGVTDATFQVDY